MGVGPGTTVAVGTGVSVGAGVRVGGNASVGTKVGGPLLQPAMGSKAARATNRMENGIDLAWRFGLVIIFLDQFTPCHFPGLTTIQFHD